MLTSQQVKDFAKQHGADLAGIASMDRFEGAPPQMDPRHIFPDAQALIALGFRIPRGCFRGIEEGTYFNAYPAMGYGGLNLRDIPITLRAVCLFLEDYGYEGVPVLPVDTMSSADITDGNIVARKSVAPDRPAPDVMVHFRLAAVAAGLGEIGYSKMLLTPEFGPRQRIALVITDAPLAPDPLFDGQICDRCMMCVRECPGKAISATETVKTTVAGKQLEWGKLDVARCSLAYSAGAPPVLSPFAPEDFDFEAEVNYENPYAGLEKIEYSRGGPAFYFHLAASGGARGCIRACMMHLEEEGRIQARFKYPFRRREPWSR